MISKSEIKNIPLSGNIDFRQRKIEKEHSALLIIDLQKAEYNKKIFWINQMIDICGIG